MTIKKVRKIADLCKFKEKNATFSCIFQVQSHNLWEINSLLQIFMATTPSEILRLRLRMTEAEGHRMTNWVMTQPLNCHFNCKAKALPYILGKTYILLSKTRSLLHPYLGQENQKELKNILEGFLLSLFLLFTNCNQLPQEWRVQ